MYISEILPVAGMVKAKTGSFYLTERVTIPGASAAGTRVQGTIDLGAYVNVPTGQAIAIESVDYIFQVGSTNKGTVDGMLVDNGGLTVQLTDLNPGTVFIRADDHSLISSASMNIDVANCIASHSSDFYPDNFGPSKLAEAFLCVNDTLFLVGGNDNSALTASDVNITARIKCRVVKLDKESWMAIAIQSTASDN
tara:strand:+ start:130 stop:714 length:585 start_codon:yes stop_codon:yes gene_type:complete